MEIWNWQKNAQTPACLLFCLRFKHTKTKTNKHQPEKHQSVRISLKQLQRSLVQQHRVEQSLEVQTWVGNTPATQPYPYPECCRKPSSWTPSLLLSHISVPHNWITRCQVWAEIFLRHNPICLSSLFFLSCSAVRRTSCILLSPCCKMPDMSFSSLVPRLLTTPLKAETH